MVTISGAFSELSDGSSSDDEGLDDSGELSVKDKDTFGLTSIKSNKVIIDHHYHHHHYHHHNIIIIITSSSS